MSLYRSKLQLEWRSVGFAGGYPTDPKNMFTKTNNLLATQILKTSMNWEKGPDLPDVPENLKPMTTPILLRSGTKYILIDRFCRFTFVMEELSGKWCHLPDPIVKRFEFGSFVIRNKLYVVGGHIMDYRKKYTQNIGSCECLDLDDVNIGWKMVGNLPALLWNANITLGPTFATLINEDTAIIGGLNCRRLFMFHNNFFFMVNGEDLKYDAFNMRHHSLIKWPFND